MVAENPEVAGHADRNLGLLRHGVLVSTARIVAVVRKQLRQFGLAEADQVQVVVFRLEQL